MATITAASCLAQLSTLSHELATVREQLKKATSTISFSRRAHPADFVCVLLQVLCTRTLQNTEVHLAGATTCMCNSGSLNFGFVLYIHRGRRAVDRHVGHVVGIYCK